MPPVEKNTEAGDAVEACSGPVLSEAKTPKSLKLVRKIIKKSPNQNSTKTRGAKVSPGVQSKAKDEKTSTQKGPIEKSNNKETNDENKANLKEQNKEKSVSNEGRSENMEAGDAVEDSRPVLSEAKTPKSLKPVRKIIKKSLNQNSTKTREVKVSPSVQSKAKDNKKSTQNGHEEKSNNNQRNDEKKANLQEQNKEKNVANEECDEKGQSDQKDKEKLGGLILMCNRKTKPDCFRYKVMGVSTTKKELVLGIKPGLKLFLYDFDLKVMHGIYMASSAGGMNLESKAFGGAFPVQVRFKVHKDCFPLPEDIFKKAIKDNYNEKKQKFKTELTIQQVKKLIELFRPVEQHHSNAHSFMQTSFQGPIFLPPPMPIVPVGEIFEGGKEPLPQAYMEPFTNNSYALEEVTKYYMPSDQEREQFLRRPAFTHGEMTPMQKESIPCDPLYLSEKEYRMFGLVRAQPSSTVPATAPTAPALDTYPKDRDMEQLQRHSASQHRETAPPPQREAHSYDPLFLSEKEYRSYGLGRKLPSSTVPAADPIVPISDPCLKSTYYPYHAGAASSDANRPLPQREATSSEPYSTFTRRENRLNYDHPERSATYHSPRLAADERGNLYSTYASNALSEYNRRQHMGGSTEIASTSVSSRYSFLGPSPSYL